MTTLTLACGLTPVNIKLTYESSHSSAMATISGLSVVKSLHNDVIFFCENKKKISNQSSNHSFD